LEQEFGTLLPALNTGQIYLTLARLERDGLIIGRSVPGDSRGKRMYELTDVGRDVLAAWIDAPVPARRLKDEFFTKFLVLVSARLAEPRRLLYGQRRGDLQALGAFNALLGANGEPPAAQPVLGGGELHVQGGP